MALKQHETVEYWFSTDPPWVSDAVDCTSRGVELNAERLCLLQRGPLPSRICIYLYLSSEVGSSETSEKPPGASAQRVRIGVSPSEQQDRTVADGCANSEKVPPAQTQSAIIQLHSGPAAGDRMSPTDQAPGAFASIQPAANVNGAQAKDDQRSQGLPPGTLEQEVMRQANIQLQNSCPATENGLSKEGSPTQAAESATAVQKPPGHSGSTGQLSEWKISSAPDFNGNMVSSDRFGELTGGRSDMNGVTSGREKTQLVSLAREDSGQFADPKDAGEKIESSASPTIHSSAHETPSFAEARARFLELSAHAESKQQPSHPSTADCPEQESVGPRVSRNRSNVSRVPKSTSLLQPVARTGSFTGVKPKSRRAVTDDQSSGGQKPSKGYIRGSPGFGRYGSLFDLSANRRIQEEMEEQVRREEEFKIRNESQITAEYKPGDQLDLNTRRGNAFSTLGKRQSLKNP